MLNRPRSDPLPPLFALTFSLLIYAKFCHSASIVHADNRLRTLRRTRSRSSGINKKVVESLPFFRFSSLRGSKRGIECMICLSKSEDTEILRLLPQCKHGFHIYCIDQWLEKHSTCPLCRQKVNLDDPTIFTYSNSMRFSRDPSELREDPDIELYVHREQESNRSSRFIIGASFRKTEKDDIESKVLIQDDEDVDDEGFHKFNHKIVMSDVVLKNRWSSVSSSDLMFLNSEMLNEMSSSRFDIHNEQFTETRTIENDRIIKIKKELEIKRLLNNPSTLDSAATSGHASRIVNEAEKRSMLDIVALSRFRDAGTRNRTTENPMTETCTKEERTRRLWLPIA
ncbi:hypothetical protein V6N13_038967 [Hibiscus sabdariffa]